MIFYTNVLHFTCNKTSWFLQMIVKNNTSFKTTLYIYIYTICNNQIHYLNWKNKRRKKKNTELDHHTRRSVNTSSPNIITGFYAGRDTLSSRCQRWHVFVVCFFFCLFNALKLEHSITAFGRVTNAWDTLSYIRLSKFHTENTL